jgi:hypothetical protein
VSFFEGIKKRIRQRKIEEAVSLIHSCGLSVVRMKMVAGECYIEAVDGTLRKVSHPKGAKK